jgi:hypothetical protein
MQHEKRSPAPAWLPASGRRSLFCEDQPSDPSPPRNGNQLAEPLRRLLWLRQELDLWNEAAGARTMPQPADFGIAMRDLQPSEIHWRRSA